jgi:hypothetical protein
MAKRLPPNRLDERSVEVWSVELASTESALTEPALTESALTEPAPMQSVDLISSLSTVKEGDQQRQQIVFGITGIKLALSCKKSLEKARG